MITYKKRDGLPSFLLEHVLKGVIETILPTEDEKGNTILDDEKKPVYAPHWFCGIQERTIGREPMSGKPLKAMVNIYSPYAEDIKLFETPSDAKHFLDNMLQDPACEAVSVSGSKLHEAFLPLDYVKAKPQKTVNFSSWLKDKFKKKSSN